MTDTIRPQQPTQKRFKIKLGEAKSSRTPSLYYEGMGVSKRKKAERAARRKPKEE